MAQFNVKEAQWTKQIKLSGFKPWLVHCAVSSDKTLYSHSAIQGGVEILLVT